LPAGTAVGPEADVSADPSADLGAPVKSPAVGLGSEGCGRLTGTV